MTDRESEIDLKPKLTPEFFEVLVQAAKTIGWSGDYVEVRDFVNEVRRLAGLNILTDEELEPFPYDD